MFWLFIPNCIPDYKMSFNYVKYDQINYIRVFVTTKTIVKPGIK